MDPIELLRSSIRAIRTNKVRSVLTTLGIIIGVASVILLVSIGNGLQTFVTKQFEDLGSNILFVAPGKVSVSGGGGPPISAEAKFTFDDVTEIANLGAPITAAFGSIIKPSTAKYLNKTYDVTVAGVSGQYGKIRNIKANEGSFVTDTMVERSQRVIVLGPKVVEKLFRPGEKVIGKEIDVSGQKLTVVGITESKGGGLGGGTGDVDSYAYLPLTTAQKIFGIRRPASMAVQTDSPDNVSRANAMLKRYFERRGLTSDDYTILEPKEILEQINTFLGAITGALSGIAAISLVVGGIGIANIMLVSVTERTREIGLRKAIGATRRDILVQFLIEAIILSALGGVIGIAIGWGLSSLISRFIETAVSWQSVVVAFAISALVGVISGLAPAINASRLNPIDALRYE
jgi:putative ABC transport system permease protein